MHGPDGWRSLAPSSWRRLSWVRVANARFARSRTSRCRQTGRPRRPRSKPWPELRLNRPRRLAAPPRRPSSFRRPGEPRDHPRWIRPQPRRAPQRSHRTLRLGRTQRQRSPRPIPRRHNLPPVLPLLPSPLGNHRRRTRRPRRPEAAQRLRRSRLPTPRPRPRSPRTAHSIPCGGRSITGDHRRQQ